MMTLPSMTSATGARAGALMKKIRGHMLGAALLAGAAVHLGQAGTAFAGSVVADAGCKAQSLPRSDDGATGPVSIGFPVKINDSTYSQLYVDNNGYVMFNAAPTQQFFDYNLLKLDTTSQLIIAPFLADIDTRNAGSAVVTYGNTTLGPHDVFCVNWGDPSAGTGVGYFNSKADKLNRFQLLLVERSDRALGDFDIIMNYDQIDWDQPDDCLNGSCPVWAGFSGGVSGSFTALPGSGTPGALLGGGTDPLINPASSTSASYTFQVQSGSVGSAALVAGTVYDPNGLPLAGAAVDICAADFSICYPAVTNALGNYTVNSFTPADVFDPGGNPVPFIISVTAPSGTSWLSVPPVTINLTPGATITGQDITLGAPAQIPIGTTVSPSNPGGGGVPTVFWGNPLTLSTHGCPNGAATYTVLQEGSILPGYDHVPMPESPVGSGFYSAPNVPAFYPNHGYVTVKLNLTCPDGTSGESSFNIYIDPSGKVHNTHGAPIEGAKVTLFRSNNSYGPFAPVPDGSAVMSPSNRLNPSFTDVTGFFGWDVIAGYYIVRVEKPGCTSPTTPAEPYVETSVLRVPVEITDLDLILDCDGVPPPAVTVPASFSAEATSPAGAVVTYAASAFDSADGLVPVVCAPPSGSTFPAGPTTVLCGATNSAGNSAVASFIVTVVDTTPPSLSLPAEVTAFATSTAGGVVSYAASASDLVSGAIAPACSPASGSLFPVGTTPVACLAADAEGNAASGTFQVRVVYDSITLLPPINADGSSIFQKWYDVPVAFTLGGASAGITDLTALLFVARVQDGVVGAEIPALPSGHANCGNLFEYDAAEGLYSYLLSTDSLELGDYQLRIDLGDGVSRTVRIRVDEIDD